jgi:hypothetical protein
MVNFGSFVLLGTFSTEEAERTINIWGQFEQRPSTNPGYVEIYVCPKEKAWRESQCSSDI